MRNKHYLAVVLAATSAASIALASPAGASPPTNEDRADQTVRVIGDGASVQLDRQVITAGSTRFDVKSTDTNNGSDISLFRPQPGVTLAQTAADFAEEFSQDPATDAKGTRDLVRDIQFFGLADVVTGHSAQVTENLRAGTYYLIDTSESTGTFPPVTQLTVRPGRDRDSDTDQHRSEATVKVTSADRFVAPNTLPAHGTVTVRNVSDTIHMMQIVPVQPGTTDAQIQAYFDSGFQGAPPFAGNGPSAGMDVLSPGHHLQLSYNLPKGTYVLLCFVADDQTGMPHALMGMHKVVTLN